MSAIIDSVIPAIASITEIIVALMSETRKFFETLNDIADGIMHRPVTNKLPTIFVQKITIKATSKFII